MSLLLAGMAAYEGAKKLGPVWANRKARRSAEGRAIDIDEERQAAALKSGDFGMTAAQRDQAYLDAQIKGEAAGLSPNEARAQALGGIPAMNAQSQQLALSQADTARRIAHEGRARKKQEVKEDFDAVTGAIDAGKDYFYSGLEESGPALADMEGTDLAVGKSSAADMAKAHGASQSYIDMAKGHGAPGY